MKIWIDGYEANVENRLGSGQFAFELIQNLYKIDQKNSYTILLPSEPLSDLPSERENWQYKILKPKKLWTRIALPLALFGASEKPDVLFSPTHYGPIYCPKSVGRIMTIFDLSFLRFPETYKKDDLYKLVNWTKSSALAADQIITISNFSKSEIVNFYGIDKKKIVVAYPGYAESIYKTNQPQAEIEKIKQKYRIQGDYIIFIGTLQPRKNLLNLIAAMKNIENLKLVIVGKTTGAGRSGWKFEQILDAPTKLGIKDKVIFTGFVPDDEIGFLMSGAAGFVLPSLWEGFGIPVVDAMASGVPVAVSNSSSLPEVVKTAGLTFDPKSVTEMELAIRQITTDKKLRQKLIKAGLMRAKNFSWLKMAKTILKQINLSKV